ncbi:MAG TPA: helix-turn-helix domain-containing protein [Aliidongia sp.]|uniref:helix-turn-helix transcriptional regulator n=1 Tax=Aliidongia sp. TaxID=1914230 RepID=UPI002DDDA4ED|nr:helix-turn-helix domain-containing protein [Aliidongia sp.]HEV2678304.1 helix-turn-helix domain-containing protein [Aliidongia sp.]
MSGSSHTLRTSLSVRSTDSRRTEVIEGERTDWRFRPHFHAGDEIVRVLAGRARLHLPTSFQDVEAGETVIVPARTIHRFEPLDQDGWAFSSEFQSPLASVVPPPPAGTREALGARARKLLAGRESLQTDVEAIAEACAVSAGYLSRAFRRETGTSLHNFHVLLALHKAKDLLKDHAPVVEAALDAGFYDQAHLTREFVRTLGMTPGTFRSAWAAA